MAKKEIKIEITIEYDEERENKPARIFLFQFLTRLNRENKILDIVYKGFKKSFRNGEDINKIALKKIDSINDDELPKSPNWLKNRTITHREPKN